MKVKTSTDDRARVLDNLLSEARAEADSLRRRVKQLEKIIMSTRLIMGHEIKKPSTAISGYLDLISDDLETSDMLTTLAYAHKAQDGCKLLDELSVFYLELLKLNTSLEYLGKTQIDAASFISEVVGHLPAKFDARNRVKVNVQQDVGLIEFSRDALKIIMLNLIENGLTYSQKNTQVRVEVENEVEKRGAMRGERIINIRVRDEGLGIPQDYLKKIFSPFVRLREDIAEGSGLGLTLVHSLVELYDGQVTIRSTLGKGTTVFLTLPAGKVDEEFK